MALELSVWSSYYKDLSPEDAMARFKQNGITMCELGTEHGQQLLSRGEDVAATGRAFRAYIDSIGMAVPQGHLWLQCRIVGNPQAVEILKRWIDLYDAIGIKNMVLHCDVYDMPEKSVEEMHELNVAKLREIAACIAGRDFHICLENLFRRGAEHIDQLLSIIERTGSDRFAVTLDTGHLNMARTTTQRAFILRAGDRLRAIHIADNEGESDQHLLPFGRGTVDFAEVIRALKETGYRGPLNFEVPGESRCPLEMRDAKLRYIRDIYNYLISLA